MTGYRSRGVKPTVFLWVFVVVADLGWSVASGVTALVSAFAVGGVAVLLLLAGRLAARRPIPVRQPVRVPVSISAHRRSYAVPRLSVRHHTS